MPAMRRSGKYYQLVTGYSTSGGTATQVCRGRITVQDYTDIIPDKTVSIQKPYELINLWTPDKYLCDRLVSKVIYTWD